jgi:hypothetical protein
MRDERDVLELYGMAGRGRNHDLPTSTAVQKNGTIGLYIRSTAGDMSMGNYEIKSEQRGGHWVAWVVRGSEGKPDRSILLVGQTREEAEARARQWAEDIKR